MNEAKKYFTRMGESWEKDGAKDMPQRAREEARKILEEHWPEPLIDDVQKKLRDIISREEALLCK